MTKEPEFSPGTVSKILWHFTGGGKWNAKAQKQGPKKPDAEAFKAICSVLESRELRLGSYPEIVRQLDLRQRRTNLETGKTETRENVREAISAAPVCCLCDIPIAHLGYHAFRYGNFAIGFHRTAAVNHGFNPVLYSLEHAEVARSICSPFSMLKDFDPQNIRNAARELNTAVSDLNIEDTVDISRTLSKITRETDMIELIVQLSNVALQKLLAYVKTFQDDEFGTIYCEREWRALKKFTFTYEDVAMIVLPSAGDKPYFEDFITRVVPKIKLPRSIPVVPWEDLVENNRRK